MDSLQNSAIQDLVSQYRAESLPAELVNVLRDFFLQKPSVTQAITNADNYAVAESFKSINFQQSDEQDSFIVNSQVKDSIDNDSNDLMGLETCDAYSGEKLAKSVTDSLVDIPEKVHSICDRVYEQYFADGCGCTRKCHEQFPRHVAFEAHLDALHLDQYCPSHVNHQHLLLLGAMNALVKDHAISTIKKKSSDKERINARTFFKFRGKDVCRKYFLYVFGCGEKRMKNVMKQFLSKGILPSPHINACSVKALVKTDPNHQRREALIFILNYAQQNALQLPGRFMCSTMANRSKNGKQFADLYLLPNQSSLTRRYIYELYVQACGELHIEPISFALWNELWDLQFPNVMTFNDRTEICSECRSYQKTILGSASKVLGGDESNKLLATQRYLTHLNQVQTESMHYQTLLDRCREDYEEMMKKTDLDSTIRHTFISTLGSMHYTFDWFSTMSLPYTDTSVNRTPSIYFKSGYKVAFFGVTIEPLRKYVLYIVPEFVCHLAESLPNLTISLMHHFFSTYNFNEKETFIHFANNSVDQMKNSLIFSYFMWRSLIGNHDKVNISFLPSGHTRCWNDLFMGVFRKKLRSCNINSLHEIKSIAERSVLGHVKLQQDDCQAEVKKSLIQAFLVGNDNEETLIPLYNWQDRFSQVNKLSTPILASNHHFEINIEVPGYILCRKSITSEIISYRLIANENLTMFDQELPSKLFLEPLPIERRYYLHENIHKYFSKVNSQDLNSKLWDCDPALVNAMQLANKLKRKATEEANSKTKRSKNKDKDVSKSSIISNGTIKKNPALPTCSYCNEIGHRETLFGKIRCPKKKKDSAILQQPTNGELSEAAASAMPNDATILAVLPTEAMHDAESLLNLVIPPGETVPIISNEDFSPQHSMQNATAEQEHNFDSMLEDQPSHHEAVISLMDAQSSPLVSDDFSDASYTPNYDELLD